MRMELQRRECRNSSLKLDSEEYLMKEKKKKRKETTGQPPLAPQQHTPGADTLEEVDRAISEHSDNRAPYI